MKAAAEDEIRMAKDSGRVYADGTPWTTAVVDGSWCQRSYGHRYTAKSGCAVIIGHYTKKLLFLGMRSVYCAVCARAANEGEEPFKHACFRNWTGPSTQMESDIIVEGFRYCEREYGLRFKKFIGDGDSSVHKAIVDGVGYGLEVQKIECANHLVKNMTSALFELAKSAKNSRFLSKPRIMNMTRCARGTISRSTGNVEQLITELKNVPYHVFGSHGRCPSDVCRLAGKEDCENLVPKLPSDLRCGIMSAVDKVVAKADSLVVNATSNLAESIMSLVAKFIGGKQFNRSQQGSYNRRCTGAGLSYQLGAGWHCRVWKGISGSSPGFVMKRAIARKVEQRAACRKRLFGEGRKYKKRSEPSKPQGDEHYGPHAVQPDLGADQLKVRCEEIMGDLKVSETERSSIEEQTRGQSSSDLWWECRGSCQAKVKSLLYRPVVNSAATRYGTVNEPVAVARYEVERQVVVEGCGLFIHPQYCFLAASPDGRIGNDGLLEVKCPYRIRDMDPKEGVASFPKGDFCKVDDQGKLCLNRSHNYFYQVQGQLQIAGREWCDLVVFTTKGILVERIERDDNFWETKMFPKLERFYRYCLLPELADQRHPRKMLIREPDYILEAQRAQKTVSGRKRKLDDMVNE